MIDETQTVHLRDLRNLGKQGGATARLDDGTDLILKPNYAVKQARGYVDGVLRDVEFHLAYKSIYSQKTQAWRTVNQYIIILLIYFTYFSS